MRPQRAIVSIMGRRWPNTTLTEPIYHSWFWVIYDDLKSISFSAANG